MYYQKNYSLNIGSDNMKRYIYLIAKKLHKAHLIPYKTWSFIYDKCHRSVDRSELW